MVFQCVSKPSTYSASGENNLLVFDVELINQHQKQTKRQQKGVCCTKSSGQGTARSAHYNKGPWLLSSVKTVHGRIKYRFGESLQTMER